jgi:predicted ATPase/DNA-binding SARP family transcriptional activator/DNA-binding CsgD family transcriptional regulator
MDRRSRRTAVQQHHRSAPTEDATDRPEPVRIGLFGGFRVWVGPRLVGEDRWRLRKARSLVKLLALSRDHRIHREQAMEFLWPGLDPQSSSNNLHQVLHAARCALEPSAKAGASSGYLLLRDEQILLCPDSALWVDADAFEEATTTARHVGEPQAFGAAIDLYAGELLPEDRYEAWPEERRAQLKELYLSLLGELAILHEERGEHEAAIEALERAVDEEPTREEAHARLMRLYALSGRRREALGQYERLREALSGELGAEPGAETTRLQQEIWAGDFPSAEEVPRSGAGAIPGKATGGKHNLPLSRTSFVGREIEVLEVKRLLAMTKLLTLTGAGGCGKTRLALEVARDLVGAYRDGAWLVELAPLSEPSLVAQAVARAVGAREQPGRPLLQTLKDVLRVKKVLLVVDNCEHLLEAVIGVVDALLDSCPHLRVLATSRERLNAAGEIGWVVPPLTVPEARGILEPRSLEAYESVRLFAQRARQRDPFFELGVANADAVARVCRRLEGIPLAVELAAARIGVLSARQISERLEDSLDVLSAGERSASPRHRSLRATLEWSHELLTEPERSLFGRLSVFAGGWTLEAAEAVCSGEGIEEDEVLDLLSELVERSLVVAEVETEGVVRFRLLEPVHQYARERLHEDRGRQRLRERHAGYYLKLAEEPGGEEADPRMKGSPPVAWLKRMGTDHANLREALGWSLDIEAKEADGGREELGLRLAVALWWFWHTLGSLTEGRRFLERAVSNSSSPAAARLRARALNGAAGIVIAQGDYEAAIVLIREGLALYRQLGDEEGIASALTDLGLIALWGQRDDVPMSAVIEELEELKPRLENRRTLAWLLVLDGMIAFGRGDVEHSVALHEESLELFREIGDTGAVINTLGQLGGILFIAGDLERALPLIREDLRLGWESDYALPIQISLYFLACTASIQEQPVRAARLWGAVEGMEEAYGVHVSPIALSESDYEGRLTAARSQLDEEVWSRAWEEGKAMSLEWAVDYGLSEVEDEPPLLIAAPEQPRPADEPAETLTAREREVALLAATGLTNREIAQELSISEHTAANHMRRIHKKLGVRSRAQIPFAASEW